MSDGPAVNVTDLSITEVDYHLLGQLKPESGNGPPPDFSLDALVQKVEREAITQMLRQTGDNLTLAAKRLGIGRQTIYNKIKAFGITVKPAPPEVD